MKLIPVYISIIVFLSCSHKRNNLDYPEDISEIKSVELSRPDSETQGKFEEIKELKPSEIEELLDALKTAKPLGPVKFLPRFYMTFTLNNNSNKRLKVTSGGKTVKGYENDYGYEIKDLNFLKNF